MYSNAISISSNHKTWLLGDPGNHTTEIYWIIYNKETEIQILFFILKKNPPSWVIHHASLNFSGVWASLIQQFILLST